MQRSKFPYTARSSAKVIRHAVSIDERRAKFRQDLISQVHQDHDDAPAVQRYESDLAQMNKDVRLNGEGSHTEHQRPKITLTNSSGGQLAVPTQPRSRASSESFAAPVHSPSTEHLRDDAKSSRRHARRTWSKTKRAQDIEEVWFAGGHGDIGGGWDKSDKEHWMLSHAPLVWMVHEAARAGLKFDPG
jgi:uncharacterized protein (DUF2235 family)